MTAPDSPLEVDFYFDPLCPWTWVTSRWLIAAAEQRDLSISWHPFSLMIQNGDQAPVEMREALAMSHRAQRVIVAIAEKVGNDAVGAFYAERGHRMFTDGDEPELVEVLEAVGLDPALAAAADDESLDALIQASMDECNQLTGTGTGSPKIVIRGAGHGFFGPVITAVPEGEAAGQLWDHFLGLTAIPEFYELKRDRETGPVFPPRP